MCSTQTRFDELDEPRFEVSPKLERRIALLQYVVAAHLLFGGAAVVGVGVFVGEAQAWLVALVLGPIVGLGLAGAVTIMIARDTRQPLRRVARRAAHMVRLDIANDIRKWRIGS